MTAATRRRTMARRIVPLAAAALLAATALAPMPRDAHAKRKPAVAAPAQPPAPAPASLTERLRAARADVARAPHEPYWHWRLASLAYAADSLDVAEQALDSALARDPRHTASLVLRSRIDWRHSRHAEAVARLEPLIATPEAFPGGPPPALVVALALHLDALGETERAAALVAPLVRNDPSARGVGAFLLLRGERIDATPEAIHQALGDGGGSAANANNFGITRLMAGDPLSAQAAFLRAIELDPRLPGPYYNLTIVEKFYLFDDDAAAAWFAKYRERATEDPDGLEAAIATPSPAELAGGEKQP